MARFIDIITDNEKQKINALISDGTLHEQNMQTFIDRFVRAPRRESAFDHARDATLGASMHRSAIGISTSLSNPGMGLRGAKKFFDERGILRGAGELALSAVTTPIRSWGQIVSGEGLGENPFETLIGAASVIPIGRAAAGLTSAGLKGAARSATAAGNPSRAAMLTKGSEALGRLTTGKYIRPTSQALEVGDILAGAEEWPLELAAEGMLEGAAQAGRFALSRDPQDQAADDEATQQSQQHDQTTGSQTTPAPPETPQQPQIDIDPAATVTPDAPDTQQAATDFVNQYGGLYGALAPTEERAQQNMQRDFAAGVDPVQNTLDTLVADLSQTVDDPAAAQQQARDMLRQRLGDEMYEQYFGEPEAEAPAPTPQERVENMVDSADKIVESVDTEEETPSVPDIRPTETPQAEETDWAGLDMEIAGEVTEAVKADPTVDPRALLNIRFGQMVEEGLFSESDAAALRRKVEENLDAIAQATDDQLPDDLAPANPDAIIDETTEYEEYPEDEVIEMAAQSLSEWMIDFGGEDADWDKNAEDVLYEGWQQGIVRDEEQADRIMPQVIARAKEMVPEKQAEYQRLAEEEQAKRDAIEETASKAKYTKATETTINAFKAVGEKEEVKGHSVEMFDDIDLVIHRPLNAKSGWVVSERQTGKQVSRDKTREEAVRAAAERILEKGEADFVNMIDHILAEERGETPPPIEETPDEQIASAPDETPTEDDTITATPEATPVEGDVSPQETPEPEVPAEDAESETWLVDSMARVDDTEDQRTPELKLQQAINSYLLTTDAPLTAAQLFAGATAAFGDRTYNSQQVYDILESTVNRYLSLSDLLHTDVDMETALDNIAKIQAVEARLPRQADRTAEREKNQQFSTPFHYAYLVNWVANLQETDTVLEPSAGTGNLAWPSKSIGATVYVNEIADYRHKILTANFVEGTVSKVDAQQIHARLPNVQPTVVVMNPPFSSTQGRGKNQLIGVNMVESALKSLKPGGRLVAIVGGGRDLTPEMIAGEKPGGGPNFEHNTYRKWWSDLTRNYLIRANVHVSGEVYKGMGTTFNTRLLVIDKPDGENPVSLRDTEGVLRPEFQAMQKQRVDTIAELVPMLQEVRNERRTELEQQPDQPARQDAPDESGPGRPGTPRPPGRDEPISAPADGVVSEPPGSSVSPGEPADDAGEAGGTDVRPTTDTGVGVAGAGQEAGEIPADTEPDASSTRGSGDIAETAVRREDGTGGSDLDTVDATSNWVPTVDSHIVKGKRVNLMETVSLAVIPSPDVSDVNINIPAQFLDLYSDAQKKAVRLILRAHEGFIEPEVVGDTAPRRGFYLGDDTGVGKTWMIAGSIIHNQNEGRKKHIMLTQTQQLINDFLEAFPIAGGDVSTTFNINDTKRATGVMISTYATLAGKERDVTRLSEMLEFATGRKPPESLLQPQTDVELISFGDLPRTFELAYNKYTNGDTLPDEVADLMKRYDQWRQHTRRFAFSASDAPSEWTDEYEGILQKADALLAAEGGQTPHEWMERAKQFDGVIVFDEAHAMKNDKSTKEKDATATAEKGKLLGRLLPNARIIYASATGTTEIANLSYMERLGIWGRGKPFANADSFIMEMDRGGIASQEVVARDLKAKGLFVSRSLDFSDVIVRALVHDLTPEQTQAYNDFANVWQQIRLYLMDYQATLDELKEEAREDSETGKVKAAKGASVNWSNFYNKQQTFFKAMLATYKMQSVIPDMIEQVEAGKKITMQVVDTYEAHQKRQQQRAQRTGTDIADIEITAREILEDYLDEETGALPIFNHEVITDAETGDKVIRVITNDTNETMEMPNGMRVAPGRPIPNMELVAKRDALIDLLYRSNLPVPPIDQVIQAFRERDMEVAEITGRKTRYYFNRAGERVKETLNPNKTGELARRFNENEIMVLIFSKKGSTGANYPATDPNHPIVQYVVDIGWEADKFKQGLGRSKRSNEVAPPEIVNTSTNMVGELRFQSTAASRAAEMGATTRGQAQEGTGLDLFDFDAKYLNSIYGKQALYSLLYELYQGMTFEVPGATNPDGTPLVIGWDQRAGVESFHRVTGIEVKENSKGQLDFFRVTVNRFLNRVLGAPSIALQNELYNQFFRRLSGLLQEAEANDTLDKGVEVIPTLGAQIQEESTIYTDPDSGARTYATSVAIEEEPNYFDYDYIASSVEYARSSNDPVASFFVREDGQIYLDESTASRTDEDGKIIHRIRRIGPRGSVRYHNLDNVYTDGTAGTRHIINQLTPEQLTEFQEQWEAEIESLPATRKSTVMMVRGLMIDVWDKINPPVVGGAGDSSRVARELAQRKLARIALDDGTNIVGRMFSDPQDFRAMLERFGLASDAVSAGKRSVTPTDVRDMIDDGWTIHLADNFSIRERKRANQPYLAVEGDSGRLEALVNDNVLQKVRPSGGRVTYVLPNASLLTFLSRHAPQRALRRNDEVELTFNDEDADIPPPSSDEGSGGGSPPAQGGQQGGSATTPQEGGASQATPTPTPTPADTRRPQQGDTGTIRGRTDTPDATPGQTQEAPEEDTTGMTDDQKVQMVVDRVSQWVLDEMKAGNNGDEAFERFTSEGIWHGAELYALDMFTGQSEEQVRDTLREKIVNKVNLEGMTTGGRGFIMLKQPEKLAGETELPADTPRLEYSPDNAESIANYFQNAVLGEAVELEEGSLTFEIGGSATATIPYDESMKTRASNISFEIEGVSEPIVKHYRGLTVRLREAVETTRKNMTLSNVQEVLDKPRPSDDTFWRNVIAAVERDQAGQKGKGGTLYIINNLEGYGQVSFHIDKKDGSGMTVMRGNEAVLGIMIPERLRELSGKEKILGTLREREGRREQRGQQQTPEPNIVTRRYDQTFDDQGNRILVEKTPEPETPSEPANVEEAIRERTREMGFDDDRIIISGMETPSEPTTPTESEPADSQTQPESPQGEPAETPIEDTPAGDTTYQYHGATFTEQDGVLSITGDQIPESFWDFYHSGGRGRNARHKQNMKAAGWKYTFKGNPRVYTFSIRVTDFERWRAEQPDDGSTPAPTPTAPQTKEQKAIDYLERIQGYVRDKVASGISPERAVIEVRNDTSERVRDPDPDIYYAADYLENHPDYPEESKGEGVARPYDWIDQKLREGLPEETQREIADRAAAVPSEDEIKRTVLEKIQANDYEHDGGYHYYMDIEGAGRVDVSVTTVGISTYAGTAGLTEPVYETKISIRSDENPSTFQYIDIEAPPEVVDKYNAQFEQNVLNELKERGNWERIGRKNAFKHANGAEVSILKDGYSYRANFTNIPNLGTTSVRPEGNSLEDRLQNALSKLVPGGFRFNDLGKIQDTLRAELGEDVDTADTDELARIINRDYTKERFPGISPNQRMIVPIVNKLRKGESITEAQLESAAAAAHYAETDEWHAYSVQGMYNILDEAIGETLAKKDVQEKGTTREDLQALVPQRPSGDQIYRGPVLGWESPQPESQENIADEDNAVDDDQDVLPGENRSDAADVSPTETEETQVPQEITDIDNWVRRGNSGVYDHTESPYGIATVNKEKKGVPDTVIFAGVDLMRNRVMIETPKNLKNHNERLAYALNALTAENLLDPNMEAPIRDDKRRAERVADIMREVSYTDLPDYTVWDQKSQTAVPAKEAQRVHLPRIPYLNLVVHRPLKGESGWVLADEELTLGVTPVGGTEGPRENAIRKGLNSILSMGEDQFAGIRFRGVEQLKEAGWTPPGQEAPATEQTGESIPLESVRSENPDLAGVLDQEQRALKEQGGVFDINLTTEGYKQTANRKILRVNTAYGNQQRDILFYVRPPKEKTADAVFSVRVVSKSDGKAIGSVDVPREGGIERGKRVIQNEKEAVIKLITHGAAAQFTRPEPTPEPTDVYADVNVGELINLAGIPATEAEYMAMTPVQKRSAVQEGYDALLEEHDFDVPEANEQAINQLTRLADSEDAEGVRSDVVEEQSPDRGESRRGFLKKLGKGIVGLAAAGIPGASDALAHLDETVEKILDYETSERSGFLGLGGKKRQNIRKRVLGIYGHVKEGKPSHWSVITQHRQKKSQ